MIRPQPERQLWARTDRPPKDRTRRIDKGEYLGNTKNYQNHFERKTARDPSGPDGLGPSFEMEDTPGARDRGSERDDLAETRL